MRAVVQRVKNCRVSINQEEISSIQSGLLVYLGVQKDDNQQDIQYLVNKILSLRIFEDDQGKMNKNIQETNQEIMIVSQFTLYGDVRKGRRPSFNEAAPQDKGKEYYNKAIALFKEKHVKVSSGQFQAMMDVDYTNQGPVTILVDSHKAF